jgi:hypothetical protein
VENKITCSDPNQSPGDRAEEHEWYHVLYLLTSKSLFGSIDIGTVIVFVPYDQTVDYLWHYHQEKPDFLIRSKFPTDYQEFTYISHQLPLVRGGIEPHNHL